MRVSFLLIAGLLLAGCSNAPVTSEPAPAAKLEEVKKYAIHGEVQKLEAKDKIATIKHQAIGDWMGPMTMEFPVKDPADFAKLKEGQTVDATVFVQGGVTYWVGEVKDALAAPAK
jgi:Cu/Ag efflux protein CusF